MWRENLFSADVFTQKTLQNLQDASDDLMMLDDDSLLIPYQIGGVFVSHSQEETQEMLEAAKVSGFNYVSFENASERPERKLLI